MFHSFSSYSPRYNKVKLQLDRINDARRRESESGSESARRNSDRDSLGSSFDEPQLRHQKHGFSTPVTSSPAAATTKDDLSVAASASLPDNATSTVAVVTSSENEALRRQSSQVSSLSDGSLGSDVELSLSRMSVRDSDASALTTPRATALGFTTSEPVAFKPAASAFMSTNNESTSNLKQSPSAPSQVASIRPTSAMDSSSLTYSDVTRGHPSLSMTSSMSSLPDSPPIISAALRKDSERTMKPVAMTSSLVNSPQHVTEDVLPHDPANATAHSPHAGGARPKEVTSGEARDLTTSHAFERVKLESLSSNNEVFEPAPAAAATSALKTVSHFNMSDVSNVSAAGASTPPRSTLAHAAYSPAARSRTERVFQRGANSSSSPALKDLTSTPKSSYLSPSAM